MSKKSAKSALIILVLLSLSLFLTGCMPSYVPKEYETETIAKGDEIIRDYLNRENITYESGDISLVTGTAPGGSFGSYPTDYVKGIYKSGEKKYTIYACVKTGEIFSDINLELVNKVITDSLSTVFAERLPHGTNIVCNYSPSIQIQSKDIPTTSDTLPRADVIEDIFGVIPSDIDSENVDEYVNDIANNCNGYSFEIYTTDDTSQIDNDFFKNRNLSTFPLFYSHNIRMTNPYFIK